MNELATLLISLVKEWPPAMTGALVIMTGALVTVFYLFLKKDIGHTKEVLSKDIEDGKESAAKNSGHIKELLSRDKESLSQGMKHLEKLLSNHVTDTNKKIDKLEAGQVKLEDKIEDLKGGQAKLEVGQVKLESKIDKLLERK